MLQTLLRVRAHHGDDDVGVRPAFDSVLPVRLGVAVFGVRGRVVVGIFPNLHRVWVLKCELCARVVPFAPRLASNKKEER